MISRRSGIRSIVRGVAVAVVTLGSISGAAPKAPASLPMGEDATVRAPEVRLRKLHLVRPDLIPYPVYYEVYC